MKPQKRLYRPSRLFEAAAERCGLTSKRAMALGLLVSEAEKRTDGIITKSQILDLFADHFKFTPSDAALYLKCFLMWGYLTPGGSHRHRRKAQPTSDRHGPAEFVVSESAKQKFEEFAKNLAIH